MMDNTPTLLVIFGISGDLARRKLLPALAVIQQAGELPADFKIVGVTRRDVSADDVLNDAYLSEAAKQTLYPYLQMYTMDLDLAEDYHKFDNYLRDLESAFEQPAQRLFYLSVPPLVSRPIIEQLGRSGLSEVPHTKLLLEKPFGTNLASAQELVDHMRRYFEEDQIYRIDHYLAKEMAQNIAVFRGGNSLFKSTWNNQFIESIEVIATEDIGIEGRAAFYEQTGAMRDIAQSHLLQLVALVLMPFATDTNQAPIPERRLSALRSLRLQANKPIDETVWRGQYEGYRQEVNNADSVVETALYMTLESTEPKWQGVPIRILTGKAMAYKTTEIRIRYRRESADESNQLVMRINPAEAIDVFLWAKKPGYKHKLEKVALSYTYADHYDKLPEPYEKVLLDAIRSDHALFASSEEVLAAWRIIDPIIRHWENGGQPELYERGSTCTQVSKGLLVGDEADAAV